MDINATLNTLGLTDPESRIYLLLLSGKPTSVMSLSQKSGLPRTTVYRLCESLTDKKFAEWIVKRQGKKIKAVSPQSLDYILEAKKQELDQINQAVGQLKKSLSFPAPGFAQTQVRYYHGKEGCKQLIWNTLKADREICGYTVFLRDKQFGKPFTDRYQQLADQKKLTDKVIINPEIAKKILADPYNKNFVSVCNWRVLDLYIAGDTYIYNHIYAVNFWNENEMIGIEIENEQLAKVQRAIFDKLWQQAKPLKWR